MPRLEDIAEEPKDPLAVELIKQTARRFGVVLNGTRDLEIAAGLDSSDDRMLDPDAVAPSAAGVAIARAPYYYSDRDFIQIQHKISKVLFVTSVSTTTSISVPRKTT